MKLFKKKNKEIKEKRKLIWSLLNLHSELKTQLVRKTTKGDTYLTPFFGDNKYHIRFVDKKDIFKIKEVEVEIADEVFEVFAYEEIFILGMIEEYLKNEKTLYEFAVGVKVDLLEEKEKKNEKV